MTITLRVINSESQALGSDYYKVFGEQGGSIGRNPSRDWVLPDPKRFISSQHAIVTFQTDTYYLADVSTNGVYVNDSEQSVGKGNTVRLNDGDQLRIGHYDITVSIDAIGVLPEEEADNYKPQDPAFGIDDLGKKKNGSEVMELLNFLGEEEVQPPGQGPQESEGASGLVPGSASIQYGAAPDHLPPEQEPFQPPHPVIEAIPEDWDSECEPTIEIEDKRPFPEAFSEMPNANGATETENPSEDSQGQAHSAPEASAAMSRACVSGDVLAFLQGAGLDESAISPAVASDLMRTVGKVFREVVQGLSEVLMARTELKSEFRLSLTRIRPVENNPLKFSVGVDETLQCLLFKQSSGYLPPVEAVREGFEDLKHHQMAMIAGMQAVFKKLLRRIDPAILVEDYEKDSKAGIQFLINKKANYWEKYSELYRHITKDAEDDFSHLFGEEFARAYEEQMQQLSQAKRKPDIPSA